MKNSEGLIYSSVVGLADRAKVTPDECRAALQIFLSPDPDDTSKVEQGIRIREVPGGWQIVNHDLYRFSTEAKREFWRQQKADQRAASDRKKKRGKSKSTVRAENESRSRRHEAALNRGDIESADAIAAEGT